MRISLRRFSSGATSASVAAVSIIGCCQ
ncbi:YSIRK-type signal peptide-containing protein [Candidatus Woesearchaeota archaeon]|nr:YSIRK-type signal peptide-containing protein [Candidatus Woesearchaeota archaeon]